jgi:hypothetical protein
VHVLAIDRIDFLTDRAMNTKKKEEISTAEIINTLSRSITVTKEKLKDRWLLFSLMEDERYTSLEFLFNQ